MALRLVLARALTYTQGKRVFRRGEIFEVSEQEYHDLLRLGHFADPDRQLDFIRPSSLRSVPHGTMLPILRDCGLGDVLMATIPLRDLVARYPRIKFRYLCDSRYVPLVRWLSRSVPIEVGAIRDLRGAHQYVIDLRAYVERQRDAWSADRIDIFSRYLLQGPPTSYEYPIRPSAGDEAEGARILSGAGAEAGRPTLGLVLRASQPQRSWALESYVELARMAVRDGWTPVLLDGSAQIPVRWAKVWSDLQIAEAWSARFALEGFPWSISRASSAWSSSGRSPPPSRPSSRPIPGTFTWQRR